MSDLTFLEQFAEQYAWSHAPAKRRFRFRKRANRDMEEKHRLALTLGGVIDRALDDDEGLQSSDYSTYQIFEKDDLVFKLIDLENIKTSRVGFVPRRGIMSPAYIRLQPSSPSTFPRYYYWFFYGAYLNNIFNGMGGGVRQNLTPTDLLEFPVPLPELATQKIIASFLDRETSRIDKLIEKKQRLVEVVRERSLSAIEMAVTGDKGLTKLGLHVNILPGYAFASADFSTNNEDIRLLRGANVSPGRIKWDDVVYWPKDKVGGLDRFELQVGDIVMGMDRPWVSGGVRVAEITTSDVPALLLQRVCKITPLKTLSKDFLQLLLSSRKFLGYFEPELTGVSVPHISGDQIANFRFAYFPLAEQQNRATRCQRLLTENDAIMAKAELSISKLQEFRSAVITSAVTGKIDVATWGKQGQTDRRLDDIQEAMGA